MLKTSLFSKGIYKSNIRRFKWGSVLYFVLLFFSTSFPLIVAQTPEFNKSVLNELNIFPTIFAMFVPTVVAFISFDIFSSKKQSVFMHSLPCSRNAIYISTLLASFTLMAIPVIINGGVMMLLSVFKWSRLFSAADCLELIFSNLVFLFIMFSVATLSANLTSNRVGLIIIDALLNLLPLIILYSLDGIIKSYVFGFDRDFSDILNKIFEYMPASFVWKHLFGVNTGFQNPIFNMQGLILTIGAVIIYILGFILYKKRNVESAGNFAAYRVMNPIFKYAICAFGTLITFSILYYADFEHNFYMAVILFAVSFILYFATEMVLKKNLKVFGAYKGYLVFAGAFILLNLFMEFTGVYGYEKRVPDI